MLDSRPVGSSTPFDDTVNTGSSASCADQRTIPQLPGQSGRPTITSCFRRPVPSPPTPLPRAGEGSNRWTAAKTAIRSFPDVRALSRLPGRVTMGFAGIVGWRNPRQWPAGAFRWTRVAGGCLASFPGNLVLGVAGVECSEPPDKPAGGSLRLTTSHPRVRQENLAHTREGEPCTCRSPQHEGPEAADGWFRSS